VPCRKPGPLGRVRVCVTVRAEGNGAVAGTYREFHRPFVSRPYIWVGGAVHEESVGSAATGTGAWLW